MEDVATTVEVGSYLDHLIAGHSDLDVHEPVFIYICAATGQTVEESDRCNNSGDLAHTYALRRVFDGHDWEICPSIMPRNADCESPAVVGYTGVSDLGSGASFATTL